MVLAACPLFAAEYHVAVTGSDNNAGSKSKPFKTISAAAQVAQPGDVITVHEGIYRERVNPPRGGASDDQRIVYQAAPGETVVIKGSEVINDWQKVQGDVWKVVLPNSVFGNFNPYSDLIHGAWFESKGREHHTGAVYSKGHWLIEAASLEAVMKPTPDTPLWFARVAQKSTTIWAQFPGVNPNQQMTEINVRQSVFYPEQPGRNYITVRGFTMEQAATPWAPPTAEQVGLIGTHWSKGWIIENNTIRYSACVGVTMGKYGDKWDNRSESADAYNRTIERALKNGWSKENIGSHLVRSNQISQCGQAGIVGSLGAIFSTIDNNEIHDIHVHDLFSGYEISGIKFHAPIDTTISQNHIYRCGGRGGIWLDWMTQGTRVSGNLFHDNYIQDLHVEVNHGPFLIDNNIFLSEKVLWECSQGGAYVHNLIAGDIVPRGEIRETPYFKPHTVEDMKVINITHGDERYYNNMFVRRGLSIYDELDKWDRAHLLKALDLQAAGNVYLSGAKPSSYDRNAWVVAHFDPEIKLQERSDGWWLEMAVDPSWASKEKRVVVTSKELGRAKGPDALFEQPDGTPYRLDTDYFGKKRNPENPAPGPFKSQAGKEIRLKVWPKK